MYYIASLMQYLFSPSHHSSFSFPLSPLSLSLPLSPLSIPIPSPFSLCLSISFLGSFFIQQMNTIIKIVPKMLKLMKELVDPFSPFLSLLLLLSLSLSPLFLLLPFSLVFYCCVFTYFRQLVIIIIQRRSMLLFK